MNMGELSETFGLIFDASPFKSRRQWARVSGVTDSIIGDIIRGRSCPHVLTLVVLLEALGEDPGELLCFLVKASTKGTRQYERLRAGGYGSVHDMSKDIGRNDEEATA